MAPLTPTRPATPASPAGTAHAPRRGARLPAPDLALRRDMPLVPLSSVSARALVTVVAIMTFLGSLTAGAAVLLAGASADWRQAVSEGMTLQVRPVAGRDIDADVARALALARAAPGVASADAVSRQEGEHMLEPWLGTGLDLADLPIPRLVTLSLARDGGFDPGTLRRALAADVPGASLDDHGVWVGRLATMARTVVVAATVVFALVLAALCLAVGFATRGVMAGNREIVGVLHFVGAEDRFIAGEFGRHFMRLGLRGGLLGGGAAVLVFATAGLVEHGLAGTPEGDQLQALFGAFALGPVGYGAIALLSVAVAGLTGGVSRAVVHHHLQSLT